MNMYSDIYIDFDHTLYDTGVLVADITNVFKSHAVPEDVILSTMKVEIYGKNGTYYNYSFEGHVERIREKGYPLSEICLLELEKLVETDRCFPDAYQSLEALRPFASHIYILTAGNELFQKKKIRGTKLASYVDDVLVCHEEKENEIHTRSRVCDASVVSINDSLSQSIEMRDALPNITSVVKRNPMRNTREEILAHAFPCFESLTEVVQYLLEK